MRIWHGGRRDALLTILSTRRRVFLLLIAGITAVAATAAAATAAAATATARAAVTAAVTTAVAALATGLARADATVLVVLGHRGKD